MNPAVIKIFETFKPKKDHITSFLYQGVAVIEGTALTRKLLVCGVELNKKVAICEIPDLDSENFQWGCSGLFIPQLLSSYSILRFLFSDAYLAQDFTNVFDVAVLAQMPENFKVAFNPGELFDAVLSVTEITEKAVQAAARSVFKSFEAIDDPNAPVFTWADSRASSLGASLDRK